MEEHDNILIDYDLLAKYFAGEASIDQTLEIEKWVNENPNHKKTFDSMYYLWVQSGHQKYSKQINITESWEKMKFRMKAAKEIKPENPKNISLLKRTAYRFLQLAAIIVIGLLINALVNYFNPKPILISKETQLASIDIKLSDDSDIKLNKNSKISYPHKFIGKQRHVQLEGEAFFEVTPDKEKPFIIETPFSFIKVVGTSFNVQAYDTSDVIEVTVITGIVELSGKNKEDEKIIIKKGEKGIIEKSTGKPVKLEIIEQNQLFWATRTLIFKDTELYIASAAIADAYDVEIEILSTKIKNCKLDAVFSDATIDEIMEVLRITFDLKIEKTNNHYKLDGSNCK
jgi:transmembrane sensor